MLARVKRHEGRTSGTFFFPWAVRDHIRAALTGTDSEDLVGLFDAGDWVTLTLAQAERALMTNYREGDPAWVEHNQARAALREAVAELKEKALWRRHYAQLRSMGVYAYSDERGNRHTLQVLGVDPGYRQNAQIPFSEVVEAAKAAGAPMSGWRDAV